MRLDCGGFKPRSSEQLTPSPAQEVECRKGAGSRVGRAAGCQLRSRRGGVESHRLAPSERTRRPEERKQERGRSPLREERRAPDGRAGQIETAVAWQLAKWQGTTKNSSEAPSNARNPQQHKLHTKAGFIGPARSTHLLTGPYYSNGSASGLLKWSVKGRKRREERVPVPRMCSETW